MWKVKEKSARAREMQDEDAEGDAGWRCKMKARAREM